MRLYEALAAGPPAFLADIPAFAALYPRINALLDQLQPVLATARRTGIAPSLRARIDEAIAVPV